MIKLIQLNLTNNNKSRPQLDYAAHLLCNLSSFGHLGTACQDLPLLQCSTVQCSEVRAVLTSAVLTSTQNEDGVSKRREGALHKKEEFSTFTVSVRSSTTDIEDVTAIIGNGARAKVETNFN